MSHDCSNCPEKNNCAIEHIAPWIDEHEEEIRKASSDCAEKMVTATRELISVFPPAAILPPELMGDYAKQVFLLGYHKGRHFPQVPSVYQQ